MRRINPFGSLFGFLLTIVLLVGLGVSLWVNKGLAFNPGPVTGITKEGVTFLGFKSHADFETQCVYCHDPLKSDLATQCLNCHAEINQQIENNVGVHSQITNVSKCAICHPEHRGRAFDPTEAAYQLFDHSKTSFSLNWHQENYDTSPMQCGACHQKNNFNNVQNETCLNCHADHDQEFAQTHPQDYGSTCLGCHDGLDRMQGFDHSQTGFTLEAKHSLVVCTSCHASSKISETPKDCKDCHTEPTMHKGIFAATCNTCHTDAGWSPAMIDDQPFSHTTDAKFSLDLHQVDYGNQAITCNTCHPNNLQSLDVQTCVDCHGTKDLTFMTDHQQQFGFDCIVCHDGIDRLSNFDHANFFPLDGKHASILCEDCHANQVFRGTAAECWQCHAEPDIHAGLFGLECNDCHTSAAWSPASLTKHTFPLNHGLKDPNMQLRCEACHGTSYIEYTCYSCHDHQEAEITQKHLEKGINAQELPECGRCHPTGTILEDG